MYRREFIAGLLISCFLVGVMKASRPRKIQMTAKLDPPQIAPAYFTLNKPTGSLTISTQTDMGGNALATFNLKRTDPPGTYSGIVDIYINGVRVTDSGTVQV